LMLWYFYNFYFCFYLRTLLRYRCFIFSLFLITTIMWMRWLWPVAFNSNLPLVQQQSVVFPMDAFHFFHEAQYSVDMLEETDANADLNRLKHSVNDELLLLEEKRGALLTELTLLRKHAENMQQNVQAMVYKLNTLKMAIASAEENYRDAAEANYPEVHLPLRRISAMPQMYNFSFILDSTCTLDTCWNFTRCPLTKPFSVQYKREQMQFLDDQSQMHSVFQAALNSLEKNPYTQSPDSYEACVQVKITVGDSKVSSQLDKFENCLVFQLDTEATTDLNSVNLSVLAHCTFSKETFRPGWDIVIPSWYSLSTNSCDLISLPALAPARRKYLLSCVDCIFHSAAPVIPIQLVHDVLETMSSSKTLDAFYFEFSNTSDVLDDLLIQSTFSLIVVPDAHVISSHLLQSRLYESLKFGAIPVIFSTEVRLPFDEILDWRKAVVKLPLARLPELHFVIRSLDDAELLELRRQGRLFWQHYLCTVDDVVRSTVDLVRTRLTMLPVPQRQIRGRRLYNDSNPMLMSPLPAMLNTLDGNEFLGPVESAYNSPSFKRNFSQTSVDVYDWWNVHFSPFYLHAQSPFARPMPSEAKFMGSHFGFRPIDGGLGGNGKEFSKALGGNFPKEQFTVVMLTYRREKVLTAALLRLANLPYLNKVIVIWNDSEPPSTEMIWPELSAPIVVLQPKQNSLNNRFLPFDEIETEAVLSVDDDVQLRHDEIIFAFRVWRETRNRIVGFPGRFHAWDSSKRSWLYNSSHACELSMVLTGAAFLHKYYLHQYTYEMPSAIRDHVDKIMNCEDLAMNFYVSHVTRLPPIKVTSRWTFACPMCVDSLSNKAEHYAERNDCIAQFTRIYGYNPLLYTQFRLDSILFKTKIPPQHQKCFKFI
ncbi:Exostosin-like 3, partial [Trichinella nelsoni]